MAIMQAQISSKWLDNPRRPKLSDVWPIATVNDITGTSADRIPPSPNSGTWEVFADEAIIAEMEADTDSILWWSDYVSET